MHPDARSANPSCHLLAVDIVRVERDEDWGSLMAVSRSSGKRAGPDGLVAASGSRRSNCNEFAVMSREPWLSFDAQAALSRVRVPTQFVHADGALAPSWAQRFHDAMDVERSFEWLTPSSQVDFYDRLDRVDTAADLVRDHFLRHL